jgi:hypothetical protein
MVKSERTVDTRFTEREPVPNCLVGSSGRRIEEDRGQKTEDRTAGPTFREAGLNCSSSNGSRGSRSVNLCAGSFLEPRIGFALVVGCIKQRTHYSECATPPSFMYLSAFIADKPCVFRIGHLMLRALWNTHYIIL